MGLRPKRMVLVLGSPTVHKGSGTESRGSWIQIPPPAKGSPTIHTHAALPVLVSS